MVIIREVAFNGSKAAVTDSAPMERGEARIKIIKMRRARPKGHPIVHGIVEVSDG